MSAVEAPSPAARRLFAGLRAVTLRRVAIHLGIFVALIAVWEWAARAGHLNELILPAPSLVGAALVDMYFVTGLIYEHFWVTMAAAVWGFAIGAVIGLSLAIGAALSDPFRRYVVPYAVLFNITPAIAVTPIVIAWFGFGQESKVALAVLIVFFPVFVNALSGFLRVDPDKAEMFRALGATKRQTFFRLMLPDAAPSIMAGLKVGMTGALIGVIVIEFTSASQGVGVLMQRFSFQLDIASSIAVLLSMSLLGLILFTLMELMDTGLIFWKKDARLRAVSARRARRFRI
jgi:NitT/TauT family transport system permease protein